MNASVDLLRLLALPVLGWAAREDLRTRRVPNRTWLPLVALGGALLAAEAWTVYHGGLATERRLFAVRVAVSVGVIAPLGYLFFRLGAFGGADAKALVAICLCFPTPPSYLLPATGVVLPVAATSGAFAVTILTNAALVGAVYPLALAARNALAGRVGRAMAIGRPIAWGEVTRTHGRLLGHANGLTAGLDLDALRMYLAWRDATLAELRAAPAEGRDPESLPAEPRAPGDGRIDAATDGGRRATGSADEARIAPDGAGAGTDRATANEPADPWGAAAFCDDVADAYGATPGSLRGALGELTTAESVWVSPGVPFLVPLFFGLCLALVYGDLLYAGLAAVGVT
ncbi:A24 family peptidase [Halococcus agarilyticus]|uniref:A24 family peptidase n=1 Tax=Halococcus agarilyticus TaxID=1232219 RepID=UPI000677674F|nr:A24 family peptidase [Halococcus agarilyticus]